MAGNLAGSLAYQLSNTGREAEGLDLARAALAEAGPAAPPRARALYLDRVAWAHTKAGGPESAQQAMRALGEAGEALAEDSEGTESPTWLYWVDAGELQVMESRVYTELHRPLRAVPLLRDVLSRYDATHARELALYLSWLAVACADANEPEEAAATAERVLSLSADVASERTAERGRFVLARLAEYAHVAEVRAVLDLVEPPPHVLDGPHQADSVSGPQQWVRSSVRGEVHTSQVQTTSIVMAKVGDLLMATEASTRLRLSG
ncbi:hypothetical protein ACIBCM_23900 [Streptomyces sp. NPDC051018]|uniref:hypothetical protein n=1 Tax=Streptomyces sp. NPDC051018 TaxID=3365639 RepID=UPI00378F346A